MQACGGSKYASVMNPLRLHATAAFYLGSSLIFTFGAAAAKRVNIDVYGSGILISAISAGRIQYAGAARPQLS